MAAAFADLVLLFVIHRHTTQRITAQSTKLSAMPFKMPRAIRTSSVMGTSLEKNAGEFSSAPARLKPGIAFPLELNP